MGRQAVKMKKLALCIFAAAVMIPFSAFAMDIITDSEMAAVTGQTGVDIHVTDVSFNLEIMNISWSDSDCGTLIVSTVPVAYGPGYFNSFDIEMKNIYITMDTDTSGITSDANGTFIQIADNPLVIDIITGSTNARLNPFCATRGMTGVVLGMPDAYISIEEVDIGGLYVDSEAYTVQTAAYLSTEKWDFTRTPPAKSNCLGDLNISGLEMTLHAYVGGYESANLTPGQSIHPLNPNHRALLVIGPH
jgi:hypothetical protein